MESSPLRVLVISEDRKLLRQVSRFLNTFAYQVRQVAGTQLASAALEGEPPEVIILDAADEQAVREFCCRAVAADPTRHTYTLLLVSEAGCEDLVGAMAAGADDFLEKPIVHGELLARLSAAARAIERERRFCQQEGVDPHTHLSNRTAFDQAVQDRSATGDDLACVIADLDLLGRVNREWGFAVGNETIRSTARELAALDEKAFVACLGGGRFGVLLENASLASATNWAERAREAVADLEIRSADTALRVTASFGVAVGPSEEVVRQAREALCVAKHSGRNYVACRGQFDEEDVAWAELAAPGRLFEGTAARHVMTPAPLALHCDETVARATALFQATRLDALPVVDSEGRLVGTVSRESDLSDPGIPLSAVIDTEVATFDESTPFAEVFGFFTGQPHPLAVITHRGRPTGIIDRQKLSSLGEPASVGQFAPSEPATSDSDYLVVADRGVTSDTA